MSEDETTVSLLVASRLMGLKQSWARDLLTNRQKENPNRSIMTRASDRGRWRVNVDELGKIIRSANSSNSDYLVEKVETLENETVVLKRRISRLERKTSLNNAT